MEYFTEFCNVTKHIRRFRDRWNTLIYLVEGEEKAVLLDTGDGFGDLRGYVEALTDKPLTVILTHGHIDHASGAAQFADCEIWMNPKDEEIYQTSTDLEYRHQFYARFPYTKDIPFEDYQPQYQGEKKELKDGMRFDLGGVHITMICCPGHTPGMTCALIEEDRTMLYGDACGVSVMLHDPKSSSCVSEYRRSLLHMKEYEDRYDYIIRNHGTGVSGKALLDNVIECCDAILSGTDDAVPVQINGRSLYLAKAAINTGRLDGKEGNIAYLKELAH